MPVGKNVGSVRLLKIGQQAAKQCMSVSLQTECPGPTCPGKDKWHFMGTLTSAITECKMWILSEE